MKCVFTLCAILVCGAALANEPVSVLNHGETAPAAALAVTAPTPALIAVSEPPRNPCKNGKCKLYSVDQQQQEFHRHRVFGGYVTRKGTRTVVRPVR